MNLYKFCASHYGWQSNASVGSRKAYAIAISSCQRYIRQSWQTTSLVPLSTGLYGKRGLSSQFRSNFRTLLDKFTLRPFKDLIYIQDYIVLKATCYGSNHETIKIEITLLLSIEDNTLILWGYGPNTRAPQQIGMLKALLELDTVGTLAKKLDSIYQVEYWDLLNGIRTTYNPDSIPETDKHAIEHTTVCIMKD